MEIEPLSPLGFASPQEVHKRIEAMKLAYSDLRRYNSDPRTYDAPVTGLLSKGYAKRRGTDRSGARE
jgi:gamma-glutamyltranspeptidase/glutathione hydrolase